MNTSRHAHRIVEDIKKKEPGKNNLFLLSPTPHRPVETHHLPLHNTLPQGYRHIHDERGWNNNPIPPPSNATKQIKETTQTTSNTTITIRKTRSMNQQHLVPLHNHPMFRLPPNQQHSPLVFSPWNQQQQQPIYGYTNNYPSYIVKQPFPAVYNPQFFPQWTPQLPPQHNFTPPYSQTQEIVTQTVTALLRNGKFNPYKTSDETYNNSNPQNACD